jgi:alpha-N-arabinofuranosidase
MRAVAVDVKGASVSGATGRILSGATMDAYNSFERPDAVKPAPFTGARVANGQLTVTYPLTPLVLELR